MRGFASLSAAYAGASLLATLISFFYHPGLADISDPIIIALPFGIGWAFCVEKAYRQHGQQALWLLLGAPFAFFYPTLLLGMLIVRVLLNQGV